MFFIVWQSQIELSSIESQCYFSHLFTNFDTFLSIFLLLLLLYSAHFYVSACSQSWEIVVCSRRTHTCSSITVDLDYLCAWKNCAWQLYRELKTSLHLISLSHTHAHTLLPHVSQSSGVTNYLGEAEKVAEAIPRLPCWINVCLLTGRKSELTTAQWIFWIISQSCNM